MHSLINYAKRQVFRSNRDKNIMKIKNFNFSLKDPLNDSIIKTDKNIQGSNIIVEHKIPSPADNKKQIKPHSFGKSNANSTEKVNSGDNTNTQSIETPSTKEEKTRKEEVLFYIMHDKFSIKSDKEYRINHTTLESTDLKTRAKDLNVLYYGKN